ncbi:MAG: hypothetical protein ACP5QH_07315 [Thermoplasmata archaeon]
MDKGLDKGKGYGEIPFFENFSISENFNINAHSVLFDVSVFYFYLLDKLAK